MGQTVYQNEYSSGTYTLTIVHNKNGGDTGPGNQSGSQTSSAASVTVYAHISSIVPTRSGYRFLGWATSANGAVAYQPGASRSKTFTRSATYDHTTTVSTEDTTYVTKFFNTSNQSATYTVYAIWEPNGSTVSTTDGTLGTAQTITITASDPSFTHDLRYSFAGQTGTIASGVSSSYSWTPAITLAESIPFAVSSTCTIYCDTYSGGTLLATTQTTCTLSVPSNVKCTIASVVLAETVAGINSKFGAYVQNKSKISVTGTFNQGNVSPSYGATVAAISVAINGQTLNTNGATTNLLVASGTNSYTFTITDTRGRTDTNTGTFNVLAYSTPSVSENAERNSGTPSQIDLSYSWSISACNNLNDKAITISYGPIGSAPTTVSVTPTTYTGSGTYTISGTDVNDTYDVSVSVADYFGSVAASTAVSATGNRVWRVSYADKRMIFYNGIQLGGTVLTEAQLQQLLAMI